jgi:multiple sugar transport system substrate-binding protein
MNEMDGTRISRRRFLQVGAMTAAGATMAACAAPAAPAPAPEQPAAEAPEAVEPTAPPAEAPAEAPAAEVTNIQFSGWGNEEEDQGVQAAIKVFEEQNGGTVKVEWLHIPDTNVYPDKILAMAAAGAPPDTGFIINGVLRTWVKEGLLLDITDMLKADPVIGVPGYFIEPQEEQRCSYDGRWYGIGSCWVAPHVYYNAESFEEAGIEPPTNNASEAWTWSTLLENARKLTVDTAGKHPGESGFDPESVDRYAIQWPTWSIPLHAAIQSNGGQWLDSETQLLALDTPEATEALQAVADLMLVEHVMPQAAAMESLGMSNTQMLENKKLAMAVDGSWALSWITKINAPLGTAVLPMIDAPATDMQAHLHSAFKATTKPEASWQWLSFLATEFYQLLFLRMGLWLPSQTALMTDEGLKKWMTLRTAPGEGVHPEGFEKIVTEYVPQYGKVLYMPPGYPKADAIITPALDAIWIGDKTAAEAMAEAVPEANAILQAEQG